MPRLEGDLVLPREAQALNINREALRLLRCEKQLQVVEGATHLFEETGALEEVADLAGDWFVRHLCGERRGARAR